jgi:acylglycerol lipase
MKHEEGTFQGAHAHQIYYQTWLPDGTPKAILLIVHGLGEHGGRYGNVVNRFVRQGYAVYALDHIGHGRSEGGREQIDRFSDYTETLKRFVEMVKTWQPGRPLFLLGHSMGGLIAVRYLLDHQHEFRGAIISAPALKAGDGVSQATITIGKLLSKVAPSMGVLALDASLISRDPVVVTDYEQDPLTFHGKTPARLAAEMLNSMSEVEGRMREISLPFIVLQGTDDQLVNPAGAEMLYEHAGSVDKTLKTYDGLYHEVLNEPEHEQVLDDVEAWLTVQLTT